LGGGAVTGDGGGLSFFTVLFFTTGATGAGFAGVVSGVGSGCEGMERAGRMIGGSAGTKTHQKWTELISSSTA